MNKKGITITINVRKVLMGKINKKSEANDKFYLIIYNNN